MPEGLRPPQRACPVLVHISMPLRSLGQKSALHQGRPWEAGVGLPLLSFTQSHVVFSDGPMVYS